MIANALNDKPLPVYGEGLNVRDWLYVEDHCKAIDLIIHKGRVGEVYNVGGHNEKRNIDIVKLICKELGKPESLIVHVGDRKGHDMRYAIDPTKIHNELGWLPETKFEDGMNELIGRGHTGVGSDIAPEYSGVADGSAVTTAEYVPMDITDAAQVSEVITKVSPDVVIHCAAWTAVDAAEDDDKKAKVKAINADGTQNIANVCKKLDCKMVYISTDYVFDGQGETPWEPDCKDYKPLNVYGETKLAGELAVSNTLDKYFIVRIAWVFGVNGKNFIKTMLNVGKTHDEVRVVNDQIGTPTYTLDLARLLVDMVETDKYGYYHATNEGGYISWYDFTKEIYAQAGLSTKVTPVTTAEYGISKAARPFNSRLDKSKLTANGFTPLPTWQDALHRFLKEIGEI